MIALALAYGFIGYNPDISRAYTFSASPKYALRGAIARGLKLAIFNSCDGTKLARSLADLSIPQVIVMREPVPDQVAQAFLENFLSDFSQGHSLYWAVRAAREKLQGLEAVYPCASWLPAVYQNPAEPSTTWHEWLGGHDLILAPSVKPLPPKPLPRKSLRTVVVASLLISTLVSAVVAGVRHLGWLQSSELWAFDLLMRVRPAERPDSRLLLITVTETDFQLPEQASRRGSLSDEALELVLQKLEPMQPQAIGLDIYRDFLSQPDQRDLVTRLKSQDNLYVICKGSDRADSVGISPPPEVPIERQSFSDVVLDPDNVLRRHLIAMEPDPASPCLTPYALSAQLAFDYLEAHGIPAEYTSTGELQMGGVPVKRLRAFNGGYQGVDTWGYQALLNYRATPLASEVAPTVTLAEVLGDRLQPAQVKDRIVLIGVTASSAGDFFSTPYSVSGGTASRNNRQNRYQQLPGVVAQAHMVSQLLSAVEDGRPLLTVWPRPAELVWIWVWAAAGGGLAGCYSSGWKSATAAGGILSSLCVVCFGLLIIGIWAPLIPAGLALVLIGGSTRFYLSNSLSPEEL